MDYTVWGHMLVSKFHQSITHMGAPIRLLDVIIAGATRQRISSLCAMGGPSRGPRVVWMQQWMRRMRRQRRLKLDYKLKIWITKWSGNPNCHNIETISCL